MARREKKTGQPTKKRYHTGGPLPDLSTFAGRLVSILNNCGMKPSQIYTAFRQAGAARRDETFRSWAKASMLPVGERIQPRKRGRKPILNLWENRVLLGYVLHMSGGPKVVVKEKVQKFAREKLGKNISCKTIARLLAKNGLSARLAVETSNVEPVPSKALARMYRFWIRERRRDGSLEAPLSKIGSIDCMYTNHKTNRSRTIGIRGG